MYFEAIHPFRTNGDIEFILYYFPPPKFKGTTCALVESILRKMNVKTGFYSSPHLVHITERIRLNGKPISNAAFSSYFWKIYNILQTKREEVRGKQNY